MYTKPKNTVAWHCKNCGRMELPNDKKYCPICSEKMQRCSRYEWFLVDALKTVLSHYGVNFIIHEQYEIPDHRGFSWHFDIYVWVKGKSIFNGYGELIEVNGADHDAQKKYKNMKWTKDYDKAFEAMSDWRVRHRELELRIVKNEECTKKDNKVLLTAVDIAEELIERSNTWC